MHRFIGEKRNALIDEKERESGQSWETRVIVKEKYRLPDNLSSRNRGNRIPLRLISLLFVSLSISLFNFSLLALENNARNPWFLVWNDSWGGRTWPFLVSGAINRGNFRNEQSARIAKEILRPDDS